MRRLFTGLLSLGLLASAPARGEEPVFSGPQAGEKLTPFTMTRRLRRVGRKEDRPGVDGRGEADPPGLRPRGKPPVDRRLPRAVELRGGSAKDGLVSGLVWLADDPTAADQFLKRARGALPEKVPIGISVDGKEGPGAYGLNRNVTLTILVGKDGRVTANFALVQPSLQADVPRVLAEVVKLIGGKVPPVDQLAAPAKAAGRMADTRPGENDPGADRVAPGRDPPRREPRAGCPGRGSRRGPRRRASQGEGSTRPDRPTRGRLGEAGDLRDTRAQKLITNWAERFGPKPAEKRRRKAWSRSETREEPQRPASLAEEAPMTGAGLILVTALIVSGNDRPVDFDTEVDPDPHPVGLQHRRLPRRGDRSGRFQAVAPRWRPRRDYEAVVHELEGRRVNLARPAESLVLAKATGRIDHEGGVRFSGNGEAAERLLTWIRRGRPASGLDGSETSWSIPCGRSSSPSAPRSRSGSGRGSTTGRSRT